MKRDAPDSIQAARGQQAQAVLANTAFVEAMAQMRGDVVATWRDCPIRDLEGQRLLLQLAKLTEKFEVLLVGYIENGKLAEHRIALDEARNESGVRKVLRKVI